MGRVPTPKQQQVRQLERRVELGHRAPRIASKVTQMESHTKKQGVEDE